MTHVDLPVTKTQNGAHQQLTGTRLKAILRMAGLFIYQILNHYTKREDLDPGFLVLDNSSNPRPDWFEYWPIRAFLLNESLDEDSYYGFLSPRFKQKTNLSAAALGRYITEQSDAPDVIIFTPSLHLTAYYLNVFEYGDSQHPGLVGVATRFFEQIGQPTNLKELVTHSRNEVYSNYFVAKPRFWRAWLNVTEQLIALAESPSEPLGAGLRKLTSYRGSNNVQMKIFIMERIPTWILARDPGFLARVRDPFVVRSRLYKLPGAIVCDALKLAYDSAGHEERYNEVFLLISTLGKFFNLQIRLGNALGFKSVRRCLAVLASYWTQAGRS
jgi:hypothetical protein